MVSKESRKAIRAKKHWRMRKNLSGTAQKPRLAVFRSKKKEKQDKDFVRQGLSDKIGRTIQLCRILKAFLILKLSDSLLSVVGQCRTIV